MAIGQVLLWLGLACTVCWADTASNETCGGSTDTKERYKVEAVFLRVPDPKDKSRLIHSIDYSEDTKKHLPEIIIQRTQRLVTRHCANLNRQFEWFAREYGPADGNQTAFELATAMLATVQGIRGNASHPAFAFVNATLGMCEGLKSEAGPPEHRGIWVLGCLNNYVDAVNGTERANLVQARDQLPGLLPRALASLRDILHCPQEMVELARAQLEVEYQHDGVRKAVQAGAMPADKAAEFITQMPIPDRDRFRRQKYKTEL